MLRKSTTKREKNKKMLRKVLTSVLKCDIFMLRNATKEGGEKAMRELTELKGKIREKKKSYRAISSEIGMSLSTFNKKINGYTAFDIVEASKIASILDIPPDKISSFFA